MDIGSKIVHTLPDLTFFCICVDEGFRTEFNGRPVGWDARIVPGKMNVLKTPERPLADVVMLGVQHKMGWKIHGPRTAKWCYNYLVIEGFGFEAHYKYLRTL